MERVFEIIHQDNRGVVSSSFLKKKYNPNKHPDVMQGQRSSDAVYKDFTETLDLYNSIMDNYSIPLSL